MLWLLRGTGILALTVAIGIAGLEVRTASYAEIAERIWENHPYPPSTILAALDRSAALSSTISCATGTTVDRAALALRALDDAIAGHSDLTVSAALAGAKSAVDDGLACHPLAAQLWVGRFYVRALSEGYRPPLRESYDRSIAIAPYEGWVMRLRTLAGSRWFYALSADEQRKLFEDMRYTVDMGFLDDAYQAAQHLGDQPDKLRQAIDRWPLGTRNRFASFLLRKGVDLKLDTDFQLKPWQHY